MARAVATSTIVRDLSIFPRGEVDQDAVMRYRDAYELGEELPPIVLEKGTNRLLDGWHRLTAQEELGADKVQAEFHIIPEGVPALLYAAGLSSRHGVILSNRQKQEIAHGVYAADPEMPLTVISEQLAVSEATVRRWVDDIIQARKNQETRRVEVRRGAVSLLHAIGGWTQQAMGDLYGVTESLVRNDLQMQEVAKDRLLTDTAYCAEVIAALPEDATSAARDLIKSWSQAEEEELKARKDAAEVLTRWRQMEHAAQLVTAWVKGGAITPEGATKERIDYIRQAFAEALDNL